MMACGLVQRVVAALVVVLAVVASGGCANTKPTLVLLVGGAGMSQLGDIEEHIRATCPDADVMETGGWDGFRADLRSIVRNHSGQGVVLIGHSFGCKTIADAAADMKPVDLVVMIDPAWEDITIPTNVFSCMWYQRADDGVERRAVIRNAGRPMVIPGDHSEMCHSPRLIAEIGAAVRGISARHALRERMREQLRGR